jgi:D-alanyl-D-alanine carboxypeptidase
MACRRSARRLNNSAGHQHDAGRQCPSDQCGLTPAHRKFPLVSMRKARQTGRFRERRPEPSDAMKLFARAAVVLMLMACAPDAARSATILCSAGPLAAAASNATSLSLLPWAPFGRAEVGWAIYEPLIAEEIGTMCPPVSPGFAAALATWQNAHGLPGTGVLDAATFLPMKQIWQARRSFVAASRRDCPPPPEESSLAQAAPAESYGGKIVRLRPAALAAYRRLVAAARAAAPELAADPRLLTIFSAYRSPAYDAARCAREGNCQGIVRATCSAHRTGLAMDLYLGAAPGFAPDSSADANRLTISRSPAYHWLVANAARFGFVNYAFEPWHWEWIGEKP